MNFMRYYTIFRDKMQERISLSDKKLPTKRSAFDSPLIFISGPLTLAVSTMEQAAALASAFFGAAETAPEADGFAVQNIRYPAACFLCGIFSVYPIVNASPKRLSRGSERS